MCGIAGQFSPENLVVDAVRVQRMVEFLDDRGPDNQNVWCDASKEVVLGHSRLSIIDLDERSNQPMIGSRWALTYNGEIFNFKTLRSELSAAGAVFVTNGDTEVILRGFEIWGFKQTIGRLAGMFAMGVYDRKEKKIHLVRDRLGIKPLYFCRRERSLFFASNPAAIIEGVGRNEGWSLNRNALQGYFSLGATTGLDSLVNGIESVGPAEIVTFGNNCAEKRVTYWVPERREEDIEQLLYDVIQEHKVSDVPTAVFLSGGVDSSVLAVSLKDVNCFHMKSSELNMAQHVTGKLKSQLEVCEPVENVDFDAIYRNFVASSGEASASSVMPYIVAEKMRDAGYTVAFSANGADELFLGYGRTPVPELRGAFRPPNHYEVESFSTLASQTRHIFRSPENFSVPGAEASLSSFEMAEQLAENFHLEGFPESSSYRWLELRTYVLQDLNPTLDYSSMANSLEVRVPFLDHRLVECALTLSAVEHVSAEYGRKAFLKRGLAAAGIHPSVWVRPKLGFSLPQDAVAVIREKRLAALAELEKENFLTIDVKYGQVFRDFQYLSSAAHAFQQWKRVWIDSGIVSP